MKYLLLFYSGAGNTEYITKKFKFIISNRKDIVTTRRITLDNIEKSIDDDFDFLGLGFPIHFRDAPKLVYDCLAKLKGRNEKAFF